MLKNRTTTALLLTFCLASVSLAVARPLELPHRYNPRSLDGAPVSLSNPVDGRIWSAWSYRDGAEHDIAISYKDRTGFWSEPVFLGRGDRRDQVQPALAVDLSGNLYLAYVDRSSGTIMLTALRMGSDTWLEPTAITLEGERGYMPALRVVGDRLVVAFRSGLVLVIRDLPLIPGGQTTQTIHDGFDPYGDSGDGSGGDSGGDGGDSGGDGGSDNVPTGPGGDSN